MVVELSNAAAASDGASGRTPTWRSTVAILAFAMLFAFAARARSFTLGYGIDPDEGASLLQGRALLQGWLPYTSYFDHRQPLLYANFAVAQALFGERLIACRIWAAVNVGVAAGLVGLIARRAGGGTAGALLAAALLALLSQASSGQIAASELFILPWSALAVLAGWAASDRRPFTARWWGWLGVAGVALGMATGVKLMAAAEGVAVVAAAFGAILAGGSPSAWRATPRAFVAGSAWLVVAAAVPIAAIIAVYARAGEIDALRYANLTYNAAYARTAQLDLSMMARFFVQTAIRFSPALVLAAIAIIGGRPRRRGLIVAGLWLAITLAAACSTRRFYGHYALTMLPPLCAIAGLAWPAIAGMTAGRRRAAVVAGVCGLVPFAAYTALRESGDAATRERRDSVETFINRHAGPGGSAYVANNDCGAYYVTRTSPPTRWIFPTWVGNREWTDVSGLDWRAEMRRIIAARPAVIVTSTDVGTWDADALAYFNERLGGAYVLADERGPIRAYVPTPVRR